MKSKTSKPAAPFKLATALSEKLEQKGWTQEQLGNELGISRRWTQQLLKGEAYPSRSTLVRAIARLIEVDPEFIDSNRPSSD